MTWIPIAVLKNPAGAQAIAGFPLLLESTLYVNRVFMNQGTLLTAGDFSLTGWGTGAAVTSVRGRDAACQVTITAGSSPAPNPSFTLNYHDGPWLGHFDAPTVLVDIVGGTGAVSDLQVVATDPAVVVTYLGIVINAQTYTFNLLSIGTND